MAANTPTAAPPVTVTHLPMIALEDISHRVGKSSRRVCQGLREGYGPVRKIRPRNQETADQLDDALATFSGRSHVNSLDLQRSLVHVDNSTLATIGRQYPHLLTLSLSHCDGISDAGLMELLTLTPALQHLSLLGCTDLSPSCLHAAPPLHSLQSLELPFPLSRMVPTQFDTPPSMPTHFDRTCSTAFANLSRLAIQPSSSSQEISDSDLACIADVAPRLRSLTLRRCGLVTDLGLDALTTLRQLTSIEFSGMRNLSFTATMAHVCQLRKLQRMVMDPYLPDWHADMSSVGRDLGALAKLQHLELVAADAAVEAVMQHVSVLHSLTHLSVSSSTISSAPLDSLAQHGPGAQASQYHALGHSSANLAQDNPGAQYHALGHSSASLAQLPATLQSLHLPSCPVHPRHLPSLAHLTALTSLTIREFLASTEQHWLHLISLLPSLRTLRVLDLATRVQLSSCFTSMPLLPPAALANLALHTQIKLPRYASLSLAVLPYLHALDLSSCRVRDDELGPALSSYSCLERLQLANCAGITGAFLGDLQGCRQTLVYLDLSHCARLCHDHLLELNVFGQMQNLVLNGCLGLTRKGGVLRLRQQLPDICVYCD